MRQQIKNLIKKYGKPYSKLLGINLDTKKESEIFKWFLASILFGKRISETIAIKTYNEFQKNKILSPQKIIQKKWKGIVKILDDGGYVRYDFSTASKILDISKTLLKKYKTLNNLYKQSKDAKEVEEKLQEFKGIGPVTTNIFLREMRAIWPKTDVNVEPIILQTAKELNINLNKFNKKTKLFIKLECAIYRYNKKHNLKKEFLKKFKKN